MFACGASMKETDASWEKTDPLMTINIHTRTHASADFLPNNTVYRNEFSCSPVSSTLQVLNSHGYSSCLVIVLQSLSRVYFHSTSFKSRLAQHSEQLQPPSVHWTGVWKGQAVIVLEHKDTHTNCSRALNDCCLGPCAVVYPLIQEACDWLVKTPWW